MKHRDVELIELGKQLSKYRKAKSISQQKLADKIDTDKNYISEVERGLKQPSFKMLRAITEAIEVKLSDVIKDFEKAIDSKRRS